MYLNEYGLLLKHSRVIKTCQITRQMVAIRAKMIDEPILDLYSSLSKMYGYNRISMSAWTGN